MIRVIVCPSKIKRPSHIGQAITTEINATRVDGETDAIYFSVYNPGPFSGVFARIVKIKELAPSSPDGAKFVVITAEGFIDDRTLTRRKKARYNFTRDELLAAFKEVGAYLPAIKRQTRLGACFERVKQAFGLRL